MFFTALDVIVIVIIASATVIGWAGGLIQALGALVGIAVGVVTARRWTDVVAATVQPWLQLDPIILRPAVFVALLLVSQRLTGAVVMLAAYPLRLIVRLPFLSTINRLAGALIGLIEGVIVAGIMVIMIRQSSTGMTSWLGPLLEQSQVASRIGSTLLWATSLVPHLQDYMQFVSLRP